MSADGPRKPELIPTPDARACISVLGLLDNDRAAILQVLGEFSRLTSFTEGFGRWIGEAKNEIEGFAYGRPPEEEVRIRCDALRGECREACVQLARVRRFTNVELPQHLETFFSTATHAIETLSDLVDPPAKPPIGESHPPSAS
ncbi:hypothetical protein HY213_00180 [Candidatus Peregrinibacteria bacterium]|nr:hypothetical protein [Candidatus Peregrinibacteria bacterium]